MLKIEEHNKKFELGQVTYKIQMNQFSDLTASEFASMKHGLILNRVLKPKYDATFLNNSVGAITPLDWRKKGYVSGVKDQGQCGSCWAFSTTGSLEAQLFKKTKKMVLLSEQNLLDCTGSYGNYGCSGGLMTNSFNYIKANKGIDKGSAYPYTAVQGNCRYDPKNSGGTCKGYVELPSGSESSLVNAVKNIGPVSIGIDASPQTFGMYSSGIYDEPTCSSTKLNHAMLIVGYGVQNNIPFWIVKNSWGTSWGEQGYLRIKMGSNACGLATLASYPI